MAERSRDWKQEESFWRDNYSSRPYASQDRGYDYYAPAYRYGTESANRHKGREWNEVEPELRRNWESYEHRGSNKSTWEEIKTAAKDAWDRVTGSDDEHASGRGTARTTDRDRTTRM